jgi:type I restriction enzyme, S subunit
MKLETLFKKFDQFADAPGAVAKMRELVLQLAVTGRLVPQDKSNESAELLLARAAKEAQKLPSATKYQRLTKDAEEHLANRELQSLPRGWVWTCSAVIGETAPRVDADDDALVAFAPMHLLPTDYRSTFKPEVRPWREVKKGYTHFADGDVGFAKITPCFQNGKGCVFANLPGGVGSGTTELHILRPFSGVVLPLYALLFYKSPEFVAGGVASFSGTAGQQRVSNDYFRFTPFPLPPLAEQKRIVAKVDELMALCDRLEAQQQAREDNISPTDLRKSILTLAVQGKLVPQNPNDEPAQAILRATAEFFARLVASKKISTPKPLPHIDEVDFPFPLPSGWVFCRLGQIVRISSGDGLIAKEMNDGSIPVYGGNGVNGYHDKNNVSQRTLVIGRVGFYCGSIHVTPEKAWVTDNAFITTFEEKCVDIEFLSWLLKATDLRQRDNATAQPVISGGKVYPTILALPPLAEQHRVVAKVEQLMSLVDELETHLTTTRTTAQNLLSALVAELTQK